MGTKVQGGLIFPFLSILFLYMKGSSLIKHTVLGWYLGSCSRVICLLWGSPPPNIKVPVCHVLHSSFCHLRDAQREDVEQWHSMVKKLPLSSITCAKGLSTKQLKKKKKNQVKDNEMRGLACKNVEETIPSPLTLYGRWLSYPCS